jgi:formylglycine-generating enzyme required for sulfatase activity
MGTLHAVAFVTLSASVGLALGAGNQAPRDDANSSTASRPSPPRQELARPSVGSCADMADETMALVPAGTYRSFFKRDGKAVETPVAAFRLDRHPVTRGAFAAFVRESPAWRRSRVQRLFAEEAYLSDFVSDTEPGSSESAPVTFVSWFAARAYCACRGKRLATLAEWELAASPDTEPNRVTPPSRSERLAFAMGGGRRDDGAPEFGAVWEWSEDFDGAPVSSRLSDAAQSNLFCGAGIRAADASDYGGFLRFSFRSSLRAAYALKNLGFRCAGDAE